MSVAMSAHQSQPGVNYAASGCIPPKSPRLKAEGLTDSERNFSIFMHLSPLAGLVIWPFYFAPLVMWLMRKDDSVFNEDHGREVMNFLISFVLIHVILIATLIGAILIPVVWIVALVNMIRGAVAAGNSEYFRYPMTWRFIN